MYAFVLMTATRVVFVLAIGMVAIGMVEIVVEMQWLLWLQLL